MLLMGQDYDQVHAKRFRISADWVDRLSPKGAKLYETGGDGPFRSILTAKRGDLSIETSKGDLRASWDVLGASYDGVLCMEVLEHIHDKEPEQGIPTEWRSTGTHNFFCEALRVTKPGGFLFLTTPNAASLNIINKVLHHQPPMVYRPHTREYTVAEVEWLGKNAGWKVDKVETIECWDNSMSKADRAKITRFMTQNGYGMTNRGEDMFIVFRKPQ